MRRRRRHRWLVLAIAVLVVVAAFLGWGLAESRWIEVKQFTFTSPDVPAEFDGTRIVFLADIHRGWFFSQGRVRSLVDRANGLAPDLVVLGGDYVYADTGFEASCFAELSRLTAPLGCFAVLGNHDYGEHDDKEGEDPTAAITAIGDTDITLLDNRAVWVEKAAARIRLGGVADYEMGDPRFDPTVEDTEPHDLVLLVSHSPDYAEKLPVGAVDLVLSGHTHGGQVTFFGLWAPYLPSDYGQKYRSGLVITEATTVIVSNGIGTIFPPIRFFARPQIVEITLRSSLSGASAGPSAGASPSTGSPGADLQP